MRRQLTVALAVIVTGSTAAAAANDFPYGQTLAFAIYRIMHGAGIATRAEAT